METEFLMSTITRIGSLMKVGFGSARVQRLFAITSKRLATKTSWHSAKRGGFTIAFFCSAIFGNLLMPQSVYRKKSLFLRTKLPPWSIPYVTHMGDLPIRTLVLPS